MDKVEGSMHKALGGVKNFFHHSKTHKEKDDEGEPKPEDDTENKKEEDS